MDPVHKEGAWNPTDVLFGEFEVFAGSLLLIVGGGSARIVEDGLGVDHVIRRNALALACQQTHRHRNVVDRSGALLSARPVISGVHGNGGVAVPIWISLVLFGLIVNKHGSSCRGS